MGLTKSSFKTEADRIIEVANPMFAKQGWVNVDHVAKATSIATQTIENVLLKQGFKKDEVGNFIK